MARAERAIRIGIAVLGLFLVGGGQLRGSYDVPVTEAPQTGAAAGTRPPIGRPTGAATGVAPDRPPRAAAAAPPPVTHAQSATSPTTSTATLLVAGDIATCKSTADEATARLLDRLPGTIVAIGDLAYPDGSWADFRNCYDPSWGRHAARTRPVIGNHEYKTGSPAAWLAYFHGQGPAAGRTWYAFDAGSWRVYVLDSDCTEIGGCSRSSSEGRWLAADLAANQRACSIAFMHHPRFSSGRHGNNVSVAPLWRMLYDARAELVVSGHDHDYERFALLAPDGRRAPGRGIREFVVGTGGAPLRAFRYPAGPDSQARNSHSHGILQLDLGPRGYTWRFRAVGGSGFTDAGHAGCH
jgi:hypothetical protein